VLEALAVQVLVAIVFWVHRHRRVASIVSGRVVATTISPPPASADTGYANWKSSPFDGSFSTSRLESTVCASQSQ
jgi:hypothetical protein